MKSYLNSIDEMLNEEFCVVKRNENSSAYWVQVDESQHVCYADFSDILLIDSDDIDTVLNRIGDRINNIKTMLINASK